jgi:hypothetical protein
VRPTIPPSYQNGDGELKERALGGVIVARGSTDAPPANAPKEPKAMREGLSKNGRYSRGGHHRPILEANQGHPVQAPSSADHFSSVTNINNHNEIQERIRVLEVGKHQDRARLQELGEYVELLKEQQDCKLKLEIRELKRYMNYVIHQTVMQHFED